VVTFHNSQAETPSQKKKRVVVAFTGFVPEGGGPYDFNLRKELANQLTKMGGKVIWGDTFDSGITHVVAPAGCRTMKTLIASLTGRWLVTPEWISESVKNGNFKSEQEYGYKRSNYLFEEKKVFITKEFKEENESKQFHEQNFSTLIETLGHGKIVKNAFSADVILVATTEKDKYICGECLTWQEFFEVIQPSSGSSGNLFASQMQMGSQK